MKKYIIFIAIMIFVMANNINAQQIYGKWVVPTITSLYGGPYPPSLITFSENNNVSSIDLLTTPPFSTEHSFISAGAYNSTSYNDEFYIIDRYICYGEDNHYQYTSGNPFPENQIINRPGYNNEFYIFYIIGPNNLDKTLYYTHIKMDNGIPTTESTTEIIGGIQDEYLGFAITGEVNGVRNLYVASPNGETAVEPAGLRKGEITSDGVTFNLENYIISTDDDPDLNDKHFDAYNLEYTVDNEGNDIIAWTHGIYNTNQNWEILDEIVVITHNESNTSFKIIDLDGASSGNNSNRIGGIEFSSFEDNMMYISKTDRGIVKINYLNYQDENDISNVYSNSPDYNYGRTFLQTAPDGHIYGVSNDGTELGRILQTGTNAGTFYPDNVFTFTNGIVSTLRVFDNNNYFVLPENSRVHYTMTPTVIANPICPGHTDGTATVSVEGGYPDYTYQLYDDNWNLLGSVTIPDAEHTFTGLGEGNYFCRITDGNGSETEIEFAITFDYFDVNENMESITVYEPEYWNDVNRSYRYGFRISNNTIVTISNSTILFGIEGRIIIESGSELIIDNTTLTHHEECDDPWIGIEVWGTKLQHQYSYPGNPCAQGTLIVQNGSIIENAVSAVELWNPGNYGTTGGIVQAKDSYFTNNAKSVHALYYDNFNPSFPSQIVDNVSYFINCTFDVNTNYIMGENIFYKHVDLASVKGFNFEGCDFSLSASGDNISLWNTGISAYDAGFSVIPKCTSTSIPCTTYDESNITGFYSGIYAMGDILSNRTFRIINANFVNNNIGVYAAAESDAVIINSDFDIGPNIWAKSVCGNLTSGFGIDFLGCINFIIENNDFEKYEFGPDDTYTGIRVVSCPSPHDIIYKNTFTGLSYGNYAEATNRRDENDDATGVEYRCNENYSNAVDFKVDNIETDPKDGMIRVNQGDKVTASANRFSQEQENIMHFVNNGTRMVTIKYYQNDPAYLIPDPLKITNYVQIATDEGVMQNLCPDNYGGSGSTILSASQRLTTETEYSTNLADYNSVLSLYESLEDGGNTTSELLDIETATPNDMWTLRNQLLGDSPHLSQEVLMAMSDRTDVLPDDAIFDILASNPDELKKDTLINYLENKEDPLPDYMINILRQLAYSNTTYKTVLINDMDYYMSNRVQAVKKIIHGIISDSIIDQQDYRNWLDNLGGYEADKGIIASFLYEDDTISALALLNMLPTLYDFSGNSLDEYNDYKTLLLQKLSWKNNNVDIFNLDSTNIYLLEDYAYNSSGIAKYSARNLLTYAYGYQFCDCLNSNDSIYYKAEPVYGLNSDLNESISIDASPNPASTWVEFQFELFSNNSNGILTVTDINGKALLTVNIENKKGTYLWDTRNVSSGVYIYTINSTGISKSGKLVVK